MSALEKLGYTNVKEYRGGKKEWLEKGLPFESSSAGWIEAIRRMFGGGSRSR